MVKRVLLSIVAFAVGITVLLGYLIPAGPLLAARQTLVQWAVILLSMTLILGFVNVLSVHTRRIRLRQGLSPIYSAFLIVVAILVAVVVALDPGSALSMDLFRWLIRPLQSALAALMAFTLALAAFRMVRYRRNPWVILFVAVMAVVLLGTAPLWSGIGGVLGSVRAWFVYVLGMAGTRGLLLGVGIGTVITALRALFPIDPPYSES